MSNPLHAAYYADQARTARAPILEHVPVAKDTFRLRLACPEIAARIIPGQFLMLRLAGWNDPLIGRPLALYDVIANEAGRPHAVDVVYLRKGKFTSRLAQFGPGDELEIWGPLGNGFATRQVEHLVMVAGGIGQTPFLAVAQEFLGRKQYGDPPRAGARATRVTLCYGARTAALLAGLEDFAAAGVNVRVATDDGSRGRQGLVTDVVRELLEAEGTAGVRLVSCGPEPMLAAIARLAGQMQVQCDVSLETPMACGIGICFTCVARVRDAAGQWDYKRTCVEGPVFDAACVEW